jgi:hypothetical protein
MKKHQKNKGGTINEESYQALLADIVGLIKEAQQRIQTLAPKTRKIRLPALSKIRRRSPKKKPEAMKP